MKFFILFWNILKWLNIYRNHCNIVIEPEFQEHSVSTYTFRMLLRFWSEHIGPNLIKLLGAYLGA